MSEKLIARLEAGTGPDRGPDRGLDAAIWYAAVEKPEVGEKLDRDMKNRWPAFTASIDAALTLATGEAVERCGGAEAILRWAIDLMRAAGATIADLPRFICIAALRAQGDRHEPDALEPDEPEPERSTYVITETVVYEIEAEDEAHAEHLWLNEGLKAGVLIEVSEREIEPK